MKTDTAGRIDIYKGSFFPQLIRDWNALPDSIITSAEGAEDGEARFTSLVRARDFPISQVLVNECHYTNHQEKSDSDSDPLVLSVHWSYTLSLTRY